MGLALALRAGPVSVCELGLRRRQVVLGVPPPPFASPSPAPLDSSPRKAPRTPSEGQAVGCGCYLCEQGRARVCVCSRGYVVPVPVPGRAAYQGFAFF